MDYVKSWEIMQKQVKVFKDREELLYTLNNPYGFRLNINHPAIAKKFSDYKKAKGLGRHVSGMDDYRREFEEQMLQSSYFKKLEAAEAEKYGQAYAFIKMHGTWPAEQEETA